MGYPRKNDIQIYQQKEILNRRQELLDDITKFDTNLPDSILHDDLDMGMLDFIKTNFKVISDGSQIPIIPKILTVQRWGEISNNWTFTDDDGNMKIPFIGVIRKPDVQPGTNPSITRTIPERRTFHYSTIKTWNGTQMGADVYKIPQPVAIDIGFEVTIVCQKFRDLNRFNKIVLQKFASRQAYTTIKGHYVPIILERVSDSSPIDSLDTRRFYIQTYEFLMLGFLLDSEEFEIKPAITRTFLLSEFLGVKKYNIKTIHGSVETKSAIFVADGTQTTFGVGEPIGILYFVSINGLVQDGDIDYYWIVGTSRVTFETPPVGEVMIVYYPGKSNILRDEYGDLLTLASQNFTYDGSTLTFTLNYAIRGIIYLNINGLVDIENSGYNIGPELNQITLADEPVIDSRIGIVYLR